MSAQTDPDDICAEQCSVAECARYVCEHSPIVVVGQVAGPASDIHRKIFNELATILGDTFRYGGKYRAYVLDRGDDNLQILRMDENPWPDAKKVSENIYVGFVLDNCYTRNLVVEIASRALPETTFIELDEVLLLDKRTGTPDPGRRPEHTEHRHNGILILLRDSSDVWHAALSVLFTLKKLFEATAEDLTVGH